MLKQQLVDEQSLVVENDLNVGEFNSSKWRAYFEKSKESRVEVSLPVHLEIEDSMRRPLIHSLQRFQIGETGDGHHLRRYAKTVGDLDYDKSVDLFIKEEQGHAQTLARVILALDGTLLTWHWTDVAFIALRRILGLKTELLILFIAEVIGKSFYKVVATNSKSSVLEEVFSLIVLDELMHLEFHTEFLVSRLRSYPKFLRISLYSIWCLLYKVACLAFLLDHRKGLVELNMAPKEFYKTSTKLFAKYAKRACAL